MDLADFDARVDALPTEAFDAERQAIDAWGEPLPGPAPRDERVEFIRARRAIRQSDEDIRAEHPEWWGGGHASSAARKWRRDRAAARNEERGHRPPR